MKDDGRNTRGETGRGRPGAGSPEGQLSKPPAEYLIVIVDDEVEATRLLSSILQADGYQVCTANSRAHLHAVLDQHPAPDMVVMDLHLGRSNREGLELIQHFHDELQVSTAFFVISGRGDLEVVEELIRLDSVRDFMEKPAPLENADEFRLRLRRALLRLERDQRRGLDPLLGIPNRGMFEEKLEEQLRIWGRHLRKGLDNQQYGRLNCWDLSLVLFDVDDFKLFNDKYGHRVGDYVLIEAANGISARLRGGDFFARYGGEEFAIVMPATDTLNARAAMTRHSWEFSCQSRRPEKGVDDIITFSSGIATLTFDLYSQRAFLRELRLEEDVQDRDESLRRIRDLKNYLINAADWALLQIKGMKKATGGAYRGHCFPGNGLELFTPGCMSAAPVTTPAPAADTSRPA